MALSGKASYYCDIKYYDIEKKTKKPWFEFYLLPSDFFQRIGSALTILGNLFTFDIDTDVKTNFFL